MHTNSGQIDNSTSGNSQSNRQEQITIVTTLSPYKIPKFKKIIQDNKLHHPPNLGSGILRSFKLDTTIGIALAYYNKQIVGCCVIDSKHNLYGHNIGVYIHEHYRGLGIGKKVAQALIKRFSEFKINNNHPFYSHV